MEMIDWIDILLIVSLPSTFSTNMNSPIRKLLVLTNQLSSGSLIYFVLTVKETNMQVRRQSYKKSIQNEKLNFSDPTLNFT